MATEASAGLAAPPDEDWMRARLDELCSWERGSASEGERRAAQWLAGELREAGAGDVRVEEEPGANGTFWWPIGLLAGAGALAGLAARRGGRFARALATVTGAAAAALIADELPPGKRRFRRLLPKRSAHHVLAEIGPSDAERTVVVMAHHDAAHTAFFFNPAITETLGENAPWVFEINDTSPPLMWPTVAGPAMVAAGAALGSEKLTGLGTFLSAGSAAFMAHIGAGEVVPGANDNGTGCIAQLALARAFAESPPENTRVLFLSTSEEALCEGMGLFMERHAPELPADRTFFLCLETVGSPNLLVLRGEGMLRLREYPAASLELLDSTADELGIEMPFRNLRLRNATDSIFPLAAGYECVSVASCNEWKNPTNYHWKTDTPDRVDYGTVADAIRLSEAVIRKLDERWFAA
ncbi:MAG TPA: M28 family peptidase [Solirubrobacterales bacterium]|nr:M28 family peptidase [Solirubrobacterales bacterium]